jgi:hypothetical protein
MGDEVPFAALHRIVREDVSDDDAFNRYTGARIPPGG